MRPSIRIQNISKLYYIGTTFHNKPTLRESVIHCLTSPWRRFRELALMGSNRVTSAKNCFWALKDISFDIHPGEIVGLVGRNGAGKSTLLKVLSRITAPTEGQLEIYGTMSSLLEVGTGFHPQLTGRENVFLSGSILGMRQSEIRKRFDEIVEFAEIDKFIDTPVKFYSTGMYVRLAFAVSAHLEPDILLVDEVLAVGDGAFRKKCLGKLSATARGERTVVFVSHNLQMVRGLCNRIIHLDGGRVVSDMPAEVGITAYSRFLRQPRDISSDGKAYRAIKGTGAALFTNFVALDARGEERWRFNPGESVKLRLTYKTVKDVPNLALSVSMRSTITWETIATTFKTISELPIGSDRTATIELEYPNICLQPGDYALSFKLTDTHRDKVYDVIDERVDVPWLSIDHDTPSLHPVEGYVTLPSQIVSATDLQQASNSR